MTSISGTSGDDFLSATPDDDELNGFAGNDTLEGGGGNDTLEGGFGNDTLIGGDGDDVLDGGEGGDYMVGGTGNDVYIIDQAGSETQWGDGVHENADEGIDEVRTSLDWGLMDNVENLSATGTGNIYLGGNALDNVLTGNSGNNYLVGEGGNDALNGGAGRDIAGYRLPPATIGTLRVVDAGDGSFRVQLVQSDGSFQDVFEVTPGSQGSATVTGLGTMAGLGTDTVSNLEDLHFYVDTWPEPTPQGQFVNIPLAPYVPQSPDFLHVSGSFSSDTMDLAALYPDVMPGTPVNANGGFGDDTISGNADGNYVEGNEGNDTLEGRGGDDGLDGGAGDDSLNGGGGNDYLDGRADNDSINGGDGFDTAAYRFPATTTGTLRVVNGAGAKLLVQLVQSDGTFETVFEVTLAADGQVTVTGVGTMAGLGTDTVTNVEDLHFYVDTWPEPLGAGQFARVAIPNGTTAGADLLGGDGGNDVLIGGDGSDGLWGGGGDDLVFGQGGDDQYLQGAGGNDFVSGGEGHDFVQGQGGNDYVAGDAGDDYVQGNAGNDYVDGGAGYDRTGYYHTNAALGGATVSLLLQGQWQNTTVAGSDFLVSIEAVSGTPFGDTLTGDDNGNWLWGSSSFYDPTNSNNPANTIQSTANNDTISAGGGDDLVQVGAGNHTLDGGAGSDWLAYNENGTEAVGATISLALQGQAQDTGVGTWTISGFENLDGSRADDYLTGDSNANILGGGAGNDTLIGGAGNDRLLGDGGADQDTQGYAGPVTHMDDYGNVAGNDTLEGGTGNDTLIGGDGDDVLDGGEGGDYMVGGAGNDVYVMDQPWGPDQVGDSAVENADEGIDEIRTTFDQGLWDNNIENLTAVEGSAAFFLGGNALDNVITGNSASNHLRGNGGNDTIDGGGGRDVGAFMLAAGTTGSLRIVNGPDGTKIVQLVQDDASFEDVFIVSPTGTGSATVTGLGTMAYLGTDTLTNVEDLHFFVDTWPEPTPPEQFAYLALTAWAPPIENGFAHVDGSVNGEVLDVNQLYPHAASTDNINVFGNGGDDVIIGNGSFNYIRGGDGDDTINGGGGNDSVAFALPASMTGSLQVVAGTGSNVGKLVVERVDGATVEQLFIVSFDESGTATVEGINSAAPLGTDTVSNFRALDFVIEGGSFTNIILPGTATDGADFLFGGGGSNAIFGGEGSDGLGAGGGADMVYGQGGDDQFVQGGAGNDFVSGGDGHDFVVGQADNDSVLGDAGDDYVRGDAGNDYVDGGAGYDRTGYYHTNAALGGATVSLLLQGQWQNTTVAGSDFLVSIEAVSGTPFADTLTGDDAGNWLWGSGSFYDPGTGTIQSGANNDTISAGGGDDLVQVGAGNHTLDGGAGSDWLAYNENGTEAVGATISLALQGQAQDTGVGTWTISGFENLDGSRADDYLTGDSNANILGGGAGNDTLTGGAGGDRLLGDGGADQATEGYAGPVTHMDDYGNVAGNDTLEGGTGNDTLIGGGGSDTATYANANGAVNVNLGSGFTFGADGNDTLVSIENAVGSGFNDTITGNTESNVLDGRGGNDSIVGAAGDDTLHGGEGDDFLQGDFGDNNITAIGNDIVYGGNGNDQLRGGAGNDQLYGGSNNDLLRGNSGVDYFDGGADDGEGFNGLGDRISFYDQRATQGVVADLRTGIISNDGFGNVETMVGIESLGGDTAFVDTFYGNDGRNFLFGSRGDNAYGFGGDDLFQVSAAPAVIDGGSGNDSLFLNSGGGWLTPDTSGDGLAEVMGAPVAGFVINLAAGTIADGYGNSGGITGIENVSGTVLNDFITGDGNANALNGGDGNDTLEGGAGDDTLSGGSGDDVLNGGTGMADAALFYLPPGTIGAYSIEDGTGEYAGRKVVVLTDAATSSVVAVISQSGSGLMVMGVGAGASLGTDTITNVDRLVFGTAPADGSMIPPGAAVLEVADGIAVDGLIADALVFMDANGNGQWDAGEASTVTAADGTFTFLATGSGPLVVIGGTNTDTGLPNQMVLTAPAGSSVINPLTTLINAVLESLLASDPQATADDAAGAVALALGISADIDLLNTDVFSAAAAGDEAALTAQKAAATIVTIIVAGVDASDSADAADDLVNNLALLVVSSDGDAVELTDQATIEQVLDGTVAPEDIASVSSNLADAASDIAAADFEDLSTVQGAALTSGNDLNNVLAGGNLDDELFGFGGDDSLTGNGGNDRLDGGAGSDQLDGGAGTDTAAYDTAVSGVTVNLATGMASRGAGDDRLVDIENVVGSSFADQLTGNSMSNGLDGGAGNDTLAGGGGDDVLTGGAGADRIEGGDGFDMVDYTGSSAAVSINLASGKASGGDALGDTLISIENVTGSAFDDILVGAQGNNVLRGGAGRDTLNGGGGADQLWGGAGADHFVFKTLAEITSAAGSDAIRDFEAGGSTPGSAIDVIDLSALDANANTSKKNDAFTFIGNSAFTKQAGQLRVETDGAGNSIVMGDVNGDGVADFQLFVAHTGFLSSDDFGL